MSFPLQSPFATAKTEILALEYFPTVNEYFLKCILMKVVFLQKAIYVHMKNKSPHIFKLDGTNLFFPVINAFAQIRTCH